jgi:hypothetical protein
LVVKWARCWDKACRPCCICMLMHCVGKNMCSYTCSVVEHVPMGVSRNQVALEPYHWQLADIDQASVCVAVLTQQHVSGYC